MSHITMNLFLLKSAPSYLHEQPREARLPRRTAPQRKIGSGYIESTSI